MRLSLLTLLLTGVLLVRMMECPVYSCTGNVKEGEVCANWITEGMDMKTCADKGFICQLPSGMEEEGLCIAKDSLASLLPGEYCEKSSQCLYGGECKGNVCEGKKKGGACTLDEECDVEMYCENQECQEADKDSCESGKKCTSNKLCYKGKCHMIGQLDDGQASEIPGLCKSYYIKQKKCSPGPKLNHDKKCPTDGECKYSDETKTPCLCAKSPSSEKFCPPGKGDLDLSKVG